MSGNDYYELRSLKFQNEHTCFVTFNRYQAVAKNARREFQKAQIAATTPKAKK